MASSSKIKATFYPVLFADFTRVSAGYNFLSKPIPGEIYCICLSSTFDYSVFISFDGIDDHIFVPPKTSLSFSFGHNKESIEKKLPKGTQFFIKSATGFRPTLGNISVSLLGGK